MDLRIADTRATAGLHISCKQIKWSEEWKTDTLLESDIMCRLVNGVKMRKWLGAVYAQRHDSCMTCGGHWRHQIEKEIARLQNNYNALVAVRTATLLYHGNLA